ncbi:hypothetical protein QN277_017187 [Acacia crassicarpa]|uniref:Uncharacterized protein n=1 Tax=Acacia crassicarpa TaxID=499986 RepID=A0AAE1JNR2_9FABA|nr:hypothetical protein QN277_017187 [Acacia crassicarpa]
MARMVELHGGHLVSHERTEEVNQALLDLIKASQLEMKTHDWSNLPKKNFRAEKKVLVSKTDIQGGSNVSLMSRLVEKLQLCLFCLFMPIESGRKLLECLKPVQVGSSPSYVCQ